MLEFATIESITKRLSGRVTVVNQANYGITGITSTTIGTDLIEIIGEEVEDWVKMYLSMIYELPLVNRHPLLIGIVEKLIIADVYLTYFPTSNESPENTDSFSIVMRQSALNTFQSLFNGLGIFIPGSTNPENQLQNDEIKQQMINKPIILIGEKLKKYIGYDYDGDNITDTDLFKLNTNVSTSFYTAGDSSLLGENSSDIVDGVRVRPFNVRKEEVDFW